MTTMIVRSGGLYTTVQDAGRDGYYRMGMPPSGAMDQYSFRTSNLLVGNPEETAALEATYIGPELEFTDDRLVAVTGATAPVKLNGESVEAWHTLSVHAGDVLAFSMITAGARLYIAISGGVNVPEYLGSRSTYTLTGIGGFEGRKLADDDRLPLGKPTDAVTPVAGATVPEELRPQFQAVAELRAVVGLCAYRLTEAAVQTFLESTWKVTKDANRVGYRLRGGTLDFVEREQPFGAGSEPSNVVSVGYPIGSVQVPSGEEPIVLLNDAVTGGGYATIATVISADRDRLAQTMTGEKVSFVEVDVDAALEARRCRRVKLDRIKAALTA